ncbi:hypothetical protein HDU96_007098 [Phlyctochytrium bullatum]|nr:hypothetical protein HDU96_007098 [Phlyctochytrium bullatum]
MKSSSLSSSSSGLWLLVSLLVASFASCVEAVCQVIALTDMSATSEGLAREFTALAMRCYNQYLYLSECRYGSIYARNLDGMIAGAVVGSIVFIVIIIVVIVVYSRRSRVVVYEPAPMYTAPMTTYVVEQPATTIYTQPSTVYQAQPVVYSAGGATVVYK